MSTQTAAPPHPTSLTVAAAPVETSATSPTMADPTPVAFALFAFALAVYGLSLIHI